MRRISSKSLWWHKKAFPVFWFGFLGLVTLLFIPSVIRQENPAPVLLIPLGMAAYGYVIMRWLVFSLVDEVWIDNDDIVVRHHREEDRFPITNIIKVENPQFMNPVRIVLTLKEPCKFGTKVAFSPQAQWRYFPRLLPGWPYQHPIAEELIRRMRKPPGLGKGCITVISDDDEHLQDFAEYMP